MYFNKLTNILQALDKVTIKRLSDYVHSPYFKVPISSIILFDYLQKQHPHFDEVNLSPAVIAAKAPKLARANKQFKAGTELLKSIEHFLALEQLELMPNWRKINLLRCQMRLGVSNQFEMAISKTIEEINAQPEKDIDYFLDIHLLTEAKFNGFDARLQRNIGNSLLPVTDTFETYYAIKKLRYHCEMLSRHQILGTPYEAGNIHEQLYSLRSYTNPQYPYVYLFVNVYLMMAAPDFKDGEPFYKILTDFIIENKYKTLPQGVKECITYLINYSLKWNNMGFDKAGSHALYWYETLIKYNLLPEEKKIQPSDYRNIVALAIINKRDSQWIERFIYQNASFLPENLREENIAFVRAQYYVYIGNYSKAMPIFQQALTKDEPIFNMIVKNAQFKCMYESITDNDEVLIDFLDSWERQLHRYTPSLHKLKKTFARQIIYHRKMVLATNEKKIKKLVNELNKELFFPGKDWVLQQLKKATKQEKCFTAW